MKTRTAGSLTVVGVLAMWLTFAVPAATATTVSSDGIQNALLTVVGGAGEANQILISKPTAGVAVISDPAGVQLSGGNGCLQDSASQVTCTTGGLGFRGAEVNAGDLDDSVTLSWALVTQGTRHIMVAGGGGNDTIDASGVSGGSTARTATAVYLGGFAGNDTLIGSPGSDQLDPIAIGSFPGQPTTGPADAGDDTMRGGDGEDSIYPGTGADTADGGAGDDYLDTLQNLFQGEDNAVDTLTCGSGFDRATFGIGDSIDSDCDTFYQFVTCPTEAECEVVPMITAPAGAAGASALASASRKGMKKKGKRKELVLATGPKTRIRRRQSEGVTGQIRPGAVDLALGARASIPVTFVLAVTRKKAGKVIRETKPQKRLKLNR